MFLYTHLLVLIKPALQGINTDTLLSAESVTVEFSITDIINGIYNIDRIGVKKAD